MSYNEMADKLCISEKTVSNHLSRISEKVGTIDRMELMEKLS
jgi:DNA-binding CsgD family transcriptional regulator